MSGEFTPEVRETVVTRSGGYCEICGGQPGVEIHHRRPRGMGGTNRASTATAANALHLCGKHHRLVESDRALAMLMGWLVPQNADPQATALIYLGERAHLHPDGRVFTSECYP